MVRTEVHVHHNVHALCLWQAFSQVMPTFQVWFKPWFWEALVGYILYKEKHRQQTQRALSSCIANIAGRMHAVCLHA